MTFESALALMLASAVFAAIPGPGVTAIVTQAVGRGLRPALTWTAGIVLGDLVYLTLVLLGLTWVARELGWAFAALKWLGAAYLVWLGLRLILAKGESGGAACAGQPGGGLRSFLAGLCVSLGNPKVIAFYCGFLPGFVDLGALTPGGAALVALLVPGTVFAVLASYAVLAARGRGMLRSGARAGRGVALLRKGAGLVMVGVGALMAREASAG